MSSESQSHIYEFEMGGHWYRLVVRINVQHPEWKAIVLRDGQRIHEPVAGEFVLMPPSVFDRARDNEAANDMIGDSHPWIRTFRSEFFPSVPHDRDVCCSSL